MSMSFWQAFLFVTTFIALVSCGVEDDPDLKDRMTKVRAALCAAPLPGDKVARFFDCDIYSNLVVSKMF